MRGNFDRTVVGESRQLRHPHAARPTRKKCGKSSRLHVPGYVLPGFGAISLAALALHLLVETASTMRLDDPAGIVTAGFGMALVLSMLLPFTALFAARAHVAWVTASDPARTRPATPFASDAQ